MSYLCRKQTVAYDERYERFERTSLDWAIARYNDGWSASDVMAILEADAADAAERLRAHAKSRRTVGPTTPDGRPRRFYSLSWARLAADEGWPAEWIDRTIKGLPGDFLQYLWQRGDFAPAVSAGGARR